MATAARDMKNQNFGLLCGALLLAASALFNGPTALAGALTDAVFAAREHQVLAGKAYREGEFEVAAGHFEEALALRPGHPTLIYNLAAMRARQGDGDAALRQLRSYVVLGAFANVGEDDDFAGLHGDPEFEALVRKINGHLTPVVASSVAFTSARPMGLIEGIAYDAPRRRFFLTSVSEGKIFVVDAAGEDGGVRTLHPYLARADHNLWGLMGVKIDKKRDWLWVASAAIAQTTGVEQAEQDAGGAIAVELATGKITQSFNRLPDGKKYTFGDLAVGADGTVFITNSAAPQIFALPGGEAGQARAIAATDFYSLQGIVVAPGGGRLVVADYGLGLLSVDPKDGGVKRIEAPGGNTLLGIDGLYRYGDDQLIAIQNGIRPNRVLRIRMDKKWQAVTSVEVLESNHPAYGEPTLGVVVGDDFYYIANSGWPLYARGIPDAEALADAKPLTVLKLPLN